VILIAKIFISKGFAISNLSILFILALSKRALFYLEYNFNKLLYFSLSSNTLQPFSTSILFKKILAKDMVEKIICAKCMN